jgi:hypothetical protein
MRHDEARCDGLSGMRWQGKGKGERGVGFLRKRTWLVGRKGEEVAGTRKWEVDF